MKINHFPWHRDRRGSTKKNIWQNNILFFPHSPSSNNPPLAILFECFISLIFLLSFFRISIRIYYSKHEVSYIMYSIIALIHIYFAFFHTLRLLLAHFSWKLRSNITIVFYFYFFLLLFWNKNKIREEVNGVKYEINNEIHSIKQIAVIFYHSGIKWNEGIVILERDSL